VVGQCNRTTWPFISVATPVPPVHVETDKDSSPSLPSSAWTLEAEVIAVWRSWAYQQIYIIKHNIKNTTLTILTGTRIEKYMT
jgi:hypothetical protein